MTDTKRHIHRLTFDDKRAWRIDKKFHNLSYFKKKLILEEMIEWVEQMNLKIDQEQYGNHMGKL